MRRPVRRRQHRGATITVAGVVVAAVAVGGVLLSRVGMPGRGRSGAAGGGGGASSSVGIRSVTVYLDVTGHPLDDPSGARRAIDGNPATSWWTDVYGSPAFGGMYGGEGLEIRLDRSARLAALVVTSSTRGWAASTYVADHGVPTGSPLRDWGSPTATRHGLQGSASFALDGRSGDWVLLWLTNLGPADRANVASLQVRAAG